MKYQHELKLRGMAEVMSVHRRNNKIMSDRIEEIKKMQALGYTLSEIGEIYGVSRQYIHQILNAPRPKITTKSLPGLRIWLKQHKMTQKQMAEKLGMCPMTFNRHLKEESFTVDEIRKILEVTGETFETLFIRDGIKNLKGNVQ